MIIAVNDVDLDGTTVGHFEQLHAESKYTEFHRSLLPWFVEKESNSGRKLNHGGGSVDTRQDS